MRFGLRLPQSGPAASADAIRAVARHAEDLGFADVWVSDHVVLPKDATYLPSSYILEPLVALTFAAAATERVGLGTTVLVLPLRPPVLLAKMLGSLDLMSGGRLVIGAASGWLEEEFDALGVPFAERGARTDETIEILRRCWEEDPTPTTSSASSTPSWRPASSTSWPSRSSATRMPGCAVRRPSQRSFSAWASSGLAV